MSTLINEQTDMKDLTNNMKEASVTFPSGLSLGSIAALSSAAHLTYPGLPEPLICSVTECGGDNIGFFVSMENETIGVCYQLEFYNENVVYDRESPNRVLSATKPARVQTKTCWYSNEPFVVVFDDLSK